jgi:hypothetical protein
MSPSTTDTRERSRSGNHGQLIVPAEPAAKRQKTDIEVHPLGAVPADQFVPARQQVIVAPEYRGVTVPIDGDSGKVVAARIAELQLTEVTHQLPSFILEPHQVHPLNQARFTFALSLERQVERPVGSEG